MLAARQQDAESMRRHYQSATDVILCIDGLQPEKGHEALYVVRELSRKRVWFAEPLLSATEDEVRRLIQKAGEWAESLGVSVGLWMSDKQEAFVKGIAAEFPDVPHRYCDNHFLRDLAKPVLEADSHAKVQMRKKVRGLRTIEQAVLRRRKVQAQGDLKPETPEPTGGAAALGEGPPLVVDAAGGVVLDYCAAVRGVLNDDQGGPLGPPGLRMAEALTEVQESLQRNLDEVEERQTVIREYVGVIAEVAATLKPGTEDVTEREEKFEALIDHFEATEDPIRHIMAAVMLSFLDGLFVGEEEYEEIRDNLDLERWFRLPKGHERRIHGRRHAGVRLVREGATLVHALDAHAAHPEPFSVDDLLPYRAAREPPCQTEARERHTIMRKARSRKKRPLLLAELEQRYRKLPES